MKPHQHYLCAILRNPEWMKGVQLRHGNGTSASGSQIASAVVDLERFLANQFDVDEDASEGDDEAAKEPPGNEFEIEGFLKDSEPPKAIT